MWRHSRAVQRRKKNHSRKPLAAGFVLLVCAGAGVTAWLASKRDSRPSHSLSSTSNAFATNLSAPGSGSNGAASLSQWITNQTDVAELSNVGTELIERGMVNEALLCFQRALQLKPDDEETNFNFAFALAKAGSIERAIHHYERAIEMYPEYADAHNNLGNLLLREKKFDAAIEHFTAAIKAQPEHSLAEDGLGRALAQQGRAREALPHFSAAVRLDPQNMNARYNLATAYATTGRTNEAVSELQELLRRQPGFAPASQALARLKR